MKSLIIIIAFIITAFNIKAQEAEQGIKRGISNNLYINILGNASDLSLNYEKLYLQGNDNFLTTKIGIGFVKEFQLFSNNTETYITFPHHMTYNIKCKSFYFEMGLEGTAILGNTKDNYLLYPLIGIRRQILEKKACFFRLYFSAPIAGFNDKDILYVPVGINLGYSF